MAKVPHYLDGPYRADDADDSPMFKQVMSAVGQGHPRPEQQGNQAGQQRSAQPAPAGNQERHAGLDEGGFSLQTRRTR